MWDFVKAAPGHAYRKSYDSPESLISKMRIIPMLLKTVNENVKKKTFFRDFAGGAVFKNPPANAGDIGSSPGPGRSHMPQSN